MRAMEDMDLARRLGRGRLAVLNARAVSNGERYRRDGYLGRMLRNQACLALYLAGVPVATIAGLFGPSNEDVGAPVPQRAR